MNLVMFGASSGLGLALANSLPQTADHVWMLSRSRPLLSGTGDSADRRTWIACDCEDPETLAEAVSRIPAEAVDLCLYCSAYWEGVAGFDDAGLEAIYRAMAVNASGFLAAARLLLPKLRRAASGHIIAIGSTAGSDAFATDRHIPYSVSKSALRASVYALERHLRGEPTRVSLLTLGALADDSRPGISAKDVKETIRLMMSFPDATSPVEIVII